MRMKHLWLLGGLLGSSIVLFGFASGPDPDVNGRRPGQTCNQLGCHVGNPLNAAGGSVTLSGLPAEYVPGTTYNLQVVVARTGQRVFGFQLSAVTAQEQQAGTFANTTNRTSIVQGPGGIRYIQHNLIATSTNPNGTFNLSWTAPSPAVGPIRFNVAGNAANGNGNESGDFIYTAVATVNAGTTVDNTVRAYQISNQGGSSLTSDGSGALDVGYARIVPESGNSTPSGVAIFGFRQNNVLVTEAGVPASPLVQAARIYAEVSGPVNTGLAIANPGGATANVSFSFTNAQGVDFGSGTTAIPPGGQIARFLNEAPFNPGQAIQGTFSLTSDVPISVIALRGYTNERGEFLITTLPVVDPAAAPGTGNAVLSHYADGGGWITQVLLVNPTDGVLTGNVSFLTGAGAPATVTANGQANSTFPYSIPRRTSVRFATSGAGATTLSGSIRVNPSGGTSTPSALVVFTFRPGGTTVTEAGVPASQGTVFRTYVEGTGAIGQIGAIQTGLAIANTTTSPSVVTLEAFNLDGSSTGQTATVNVAASGQDAKFLIELFPNLPLPFRGVLRISTNGGGISVVGLRGRTNERGDFLITTTPPTNESGTPSNNELLFPHLVNGGGYTTQFVVFSGIAGQAVSGSIRFFRQDGTGLPLIFQ